MTGSLAVKSWRAAAAARSAATQPAAAFSDRSALLDCIRAAAILMVFLFHVATRYPEASLDPVARFFHQYGFLGVDIFFPLSGFLITRFLLTSPRPDFVRAFFLRRVFRILPLYYVAVAVYVAASLATGTGSEVLGRIWVTVLFLTGWASFLDGLQSVPYGITWSLSVEEFGYALLGLMAWISRRHLPLFLVLATGFAIALRLGLEAAAFGQPYYLPPARLDAIAIGGLTAVLLTRWQSLALPVLAAALAIAMATMGPLNYTAVALATGLLIALAEGPLRGFTNAPLRAVAAIGFYSYFNYLFHFFTIEALLRVSGKVLGAPPPFWIAAAVALALVQIQALVSFRLFEAPLMRFGRRFERPAASSARPAALGPLAPRPA